MTSSVRDDRLAGLQEVGVRPPLRGYLRDVAARRDFVIALPVGQLRSRNANTVLGGLWHLLNPLTLALAYYLVFGVLFDARDDVDNYVGFLVTGLFVFHYTQKCLTGGASTIAANERIVRNVNLPRAVFPVGSVLAETLAHVPALGLLLGLLLVTGETPTATWLLLPLLVLLQALFNLGLAFWVGRLTFHFRDVQNVLPFVTRLLLYLSGVFYSVERVPEAWRALFRANPVHEFIALHRGVLMEGEVDPRTAAAATAWALGTLVTGLLFFWQAEDSYGRD